MKIIELFDEVPIENILGAVSFVPEEIIYVGVIRKTVFESKFLTGIKQYLSYKKLSRIRIRYVQVKRNDINDAVDKLSKEIDGDALVDITGGYDTLLFAAGIAAADLNDAAFFRINPKNGNVTVSGKGVFFPNRRGSDNKASFSTHVIKNTVEENIALHGGEIADSGTKFEYTEDFVNDVEKLWRLCSRGVPGYMHKRSAPQTWNQFVFRSAGIEHMSREKQLEALKKYKVQRYLEELMRLGFISYRRKNDGTLSDFSYKNNQIRLCLSKAGDALEQKVYLTLKKYIGSGINDLKVGVTLRWESDLGKGIYAVENEIDVFAMCGAVPVFVSCKNGKFSSEELYKLSTVADRFGKKYAKKILVASDFAHCADSQTVRHLRTRAEEMNIKIIENVHRMSDEEFEKSLRCAVIG